MAGNDPREHGVSDEGYFPRWQVGTGLGGPIMAPDQEFVTSLPRLIDVAMRREDPDLVLKCGSVVNVFTGEIIESDVAICGSRIAGVGSYDGPNEIFLKGKYICPGFIDAHVHIESSMLGVSEYARTVVSHGTTTVIIDPHEIANVMGAEGILYMLKSSKYNPMNVFMMLPSCVPASNLETAGAELHAIDLFPFFSDKWVLGLGEVMNYHGVVNGDSEILERIRIASGRRIDGHAPGLSSGQLNAYIAVGIKSDHESTTLEEAREKLQLGMYIMMREGSTTRNLKDLLPLVTPENSSRCIFVTDDKLPGDLIEEGHIDHMVRMAVEAGVAPAIATRMAAANAANYYGLEHIGAIAPGYLADVAVLKDFENCEVELVLKSGKVVARNGEVLYEIRSGHQPLIRGSVNVKAFEPEALAIEAKGRTANIIGLIPQQITTRRLRERVKIVGNHVVADPEADVLKLAVIERHSATGNIGLGLVKGFGLRHGAIASSVAHDSHNIIVVGTNDPDMHAAVQYIISMQGGLCVVRDGKVLEDLPLPVAGLMSNLPAEEVAAKRSALVKVCAGLGSVPPDPLGCLSFLSLSVIPEIKLTDKGLVDVEKLEIIDLFQE